MLQPDDLEALFQIHGDPETNRYKSVGPLKTVEEAAALLDRWIGQWHEARFGYWERLGMSLRGALHDVPGPGPSLLY